MTRLGNVNLDAINELEELEGRHEFLTGQRDDLDQSHRQLQQLIAYALAELGEDHLDVVNVESLLTA